MEYAKLKIKGIYSKLLSTTLLLIARKQLASGEWIGRMEGWKSPPPEGQGWVGKIVILK
jgi:hypothetical protein